MMVIGLLHLSSKKNAIQIIIIKKYIYIYYQGIYYQVILDYISNVLILYIYIL